MEVSGSVALVSGAAAGIGEGITVRLAREGASMVVADIDEVMGTRLAGRLPSAVFARCDVTDDSDLRSAVNLAEKSFGRLDILINNAGGASDPQYPHAPPQHWSRVLDLNLRSVMRAVQLALPLLSVRGGAVVNIASIAAIGHAAHAAPAYAAAKAGVLRFTSSAAPGLMAQGVRMNAICPDWVDTPSSRRDRQTMTSAELAQLPPILSPAEIADVAISLIRDESAIGRTIVMRGGQQPWALPDVI